MAFISDVKRKRIMFVSTLYFLFGCLVALGLYKPLNSNNIDEQLRAQILYNTKSVVSLQYWVMASILLFVVYPYSLVLTGFLSSSILFGFVRHVPSIKKQLIALERPCNVGIPASSPATATIRS